MTSVADRLYSWRHTYRLTQAALAEELGVNLRTVGRWERRECAPAADQLRRINSLLAGPPMGWQRDA